MKFGRHPVTGPASRANRNGLGSVAAIKAGPRAFR
jgi:hypothetical protein